MKSIQKQITPDSIMEAVGKYYGESVSDIKSQKRRPEKTVIARQVAMYLIRKMLLLPILEISAAFGKHHTAVLHSLKTTEDQLETDGSLRKAVDDLCNIITE